jgi:hypothetical protein
MSAKETNEVNRVIGEITKLKPSQRMAVLKKLVHLIDQPVPSKKAPKLTDLAGLGAEIWRDVDPDEYIRKLRDEWA